MNYVYSELCDLHVHVCHYHFLSSLFLIASPSPPPLLFPPLLLPALQGPAQDLLAVMQSPSSLTVWNAGTGTKVNRVTFSETIEAFTFSPFQAEILVCECVWGGGECYHHLPTPAIATPSPPSLSSSLMSSSSPSAIS